jgi:hypothetical protein
MRRSGLSESDGFRWFCLNMRHGYGSAPRPVQKAGNSSVIRSRSPVERSGLYEESLVRITSSKSKRTELCSDRPSVSSTSSPVKPSELDTSQSLRWADGSSLVCSVLEPIVWRSGHAGHHRADDAPAGPRSSRAIAACPLSVTSARPCRDSPSGRRGGRRPCHFW